MNILFYGRGAVATLYGWALAQAGHSVEFWDRPDEEDRTIASLKILDARTNPKGVTVAGSWAPVIKTDFPETHEYDLMAVCVRHDRLGLALKSLRPRLGGSALLVFGNVWEEPKMLSEGWPADRLAWAYPSAGGLVDDEGTLSGALLANVHVGGIEAEPTSVQRAVTELFLQAGFRVEEHDDFRGWLWLQFVVGAGMAAQSLEAGSVERLMRSPVELKKAILTIRELFSLVAARGADLSHFIAETGPFRFPAWLGGLILQTTLRSQEPVRVVWEAGDASERMAICRDVLAEARRLGIPVPRLKASEALFTPS
jgi:2-dehydropantoate 2-reductase